MHEVHISYRITGELGEDAVAPELACLNDEERRRASQFVHSVDRRDFIAAHALLRRSLSALERRDPADWAFARTSAGKPYLADGSGNRLAFNLSHTRGLVACAVARECDLGIDVERIGDGRDVVNLARRHFSAREVAELERRAPGDRAWHFTEVWTLKEAHAKATSAGITGRLDTPTFTLGSDASRSLSFESDDDALGRTWHFAVFGLLDYRLAIAVGTSGPQGIEMCMHEHAAPTAQAHSGPSVQLLRASTADSAVRMC